MAKLSEQFSRRDFLRSSLIVAGSAALPMEDLFAGDSPVKPPASQSNAVFNAPLEVVALTRLGFGPSPRGIEKFRTLAKTPEKQFDAYVEEQLAPERVSDTRLEERLTKEKFTTLSKSPKQLWADHSGADEGMKVLPMNELEAATWIRAVYSERQLQEAVVQFWHDHFSVYAWEPKIAPLFVSYDRDVIRKHAFGNFREMLEEVAKSPAMLLYLDNALNQSGNPNENYARELFELHTLGAENYLGTKDRKQIQGFKAGHPAGYVDGDVYEASRAFTGWRLGKDANEGRFEYFEQWHDRFQKIVLGRQLKEYQPPLRDGRDVLDLVSEHPGTARFIARKLCRRFVSDLPPETLVEKAAEVFKKASKSPDQIRQTLRVILLSEELKKSFGQKAKRPFAAVAGVLRATEAEFSPGEAFTRNFEKTGHRLFGCRTPDGYPDTRERWATTGSLLERWRLTSQIMAGHLPGALVDLERWFASPTFSAESVQKLASQWLGYPLPVSAVKAVADFLAQPEKARQRVPMAAAMIFMAPEYQLG